MNARRPSVTANSAPRRQTIVVNPAVAFNAGVKSFNEHALDCVFCKEPLKAYHDSKNLCSTGRDKSGPIRDFFKRKAEELEQNWPETYTKLDVDAPANISGPASGIWEVLSERRNRRILDATQRASSTPARRGHSRVNSVESVDSTLGQSIGSDSPRRHLYYIQEGRRVYNPTYPNSYPPSPVSAPRGAVYTVENSRPPRRERRPSFVEREQPHPTYPTRQ